MVLPLSFSEEVVPAQLPPVDVRVGAGAIEKVEEDLERLCIWNEGSEGEPEIGAEDGNVEGLMCRFHQRAQTTLREF